MSRSEDERISVHQGCELVRSAAHVTGFDGEIPHEFTLQTQVVLIGVWRPQVWINEIHAAAAARSPASIGKINILRWRLRRERIGLACVSEGIVKSVRSRKEE